MAEDQREESFFRRYLEPVDRLNEVLFGLIMVLTFTLTAGFTVGEGRDSVRTLLLATLGCNLAWGIIDGAMYLTSALLERSRRARSLDLVQRAPDEATALEEIRRALSGGLLSLATDEERERLVRAIHPLARRAAPARTRLHKEDLYGALASGLLVVLSSVPAAIPFLLIDDAWWGLRVSNALLVGMLFVVGYQWGVHAYARPWLSGLTFLIAGLALVALAIALGG
jgi:hypothetical protein